MKAEADSVVAIQAANADMFFTVGKEWTTCTMETGFIEKELDTSRNGISFGIGLSEITYFRNLVIEPISSDDDGLPTLVFDITTEGINQYLNTQNKADKIIEVKKVVDASGMATGYAITINAPLSHKDENNVVQQDVKLHLRDYAKSVGVNNVSFKVSNTGEYPFATSFMADTASNNSMAWNNVRTPVAKNGFNTCKIDFPNYAVKITYKNKNNDITDCILYTGFITYVEEKDTIYIVGKELNNDKLYPVIIADSIINIEQTELYNYCYLNGEFKDIYNQMFSISTSEPYKVEVVFDNIFNIFNKLKRLSSKRKETSSIKIMNNKIYYTDTIRGLHDFATYLRRYGKSCKVVKPIELIEIMNNSIKRTLDEYEKLRREENTNNE